MRPRTQKQSQVKKELCRVLDDVDVDEAWRVSSKRLKSVFPFSVLKRLYRPLRPVN